MGLSGCTEVFAGFIINYGNSDDSNFTWNFFRVGILGWKIWTKRNGYRSEDRKDVQRRKLGLQLNKINK